MSGHQSGSVVLTESEKFALSASVDTALMTSRLKPERDVKIQLTVATVVTARLASQAGRVAEVVEKVHLAHELVDGGVIPLYQCAAEGCEWTCDRIEFSPTEAVQLHAAHLGAAVAAELEADHG